MKSTEHVWIRILLAGGSLAVACGGGTSPAPSGSSGSSTAGTGAGGFSSGTMSASGESGGAGVSSGSTSPSSSTDPGASSSIDTGSSSSSSVPAGGGDSDASNTGGGSTGVGDSAIGGHLDAGLDATVDAGTDDGSAPSDGSHGTVVDASKPITVWLAGDSTMQPCTTSCPCGWGSQFQPYFTGKATVVDSAAGGRSIQTWLYDPNVSATVANGECVVNPKTYSARWQAMLDPTNGMKPGDYLFIEFGINDTSPCPKHVGSALFQTYLAMMAKAAKDRGVQPIFLTSTSAIICNGNTVAPDDRAFGPETRAAGLADNVPVIELTRLSAALYDSLGFCPNDGNYLSTTTALGKFFCNDHTHFEAAGAVQIAGVVAKALRDQNIGLAAYLK